MSPWEASCYAGSAVEPILKQTLRDMRCSVRGATTALAIAAVMALSACGGTIGGTKQTIGTVVGAAGGGLLGSTIGSGTGRLIAVGAGTLLGGYLGSEVGASLDKADEVHAQQAATRALETAPTGSIVSWKNPDSGNHGQVVPQRTFEMGGGPCREYQTTVWVGGRAEAGDRKSTRLTSRH